MLLLECEVWAARGRSLIYKGTSAKTQDATRGASFVTEFDLATGACRQWVESYDQYDKVIRVHPKRMNGQPVDGQYYPPTGKGVRKMEMTYLTGSELSEMLRKAMIDGYAVDKIARIAFDIYQKYGLHLTSKMDDVLLMLMAMDQGPEFELQKSEFIDLINEVGAL